MRDDTSGSEDAEKIVLKIGGSVITKKDAASFPFGIDKIKEHADEYIRYDVIRRICRELKESLELKQMQIIIVNGVGPFGHFLVAHGRPDEEVRQSVKHLNDKLVSELKKFGLKVVPVAPSKSCEFVDGKFDISYLWEVASLTLEEGKILSTYGDMLNDYKVISGDDLVVMLAEEWQADMIISATDVDGVYTKNPSVHKDAKLVKRLSASDSMVEYSKTKTDISGEMMSKVEKLKPAVMKGIRCQIINGLKEGNVKAALLGDEDIGTLITP